MTDVEFSPVMWYINHQVISARNSIVCSDASHFTVPKFKVLASKCL